MLILGIDFETTSPDSLSARPIEVAVILWDEAWNERGRFETLMRPHNHLGLTEEITRITGITDAMIDAKAIPTDNAFRKLNEWMGMADAYIAHNAQYDRTVYEEESKRLGFIPWEKPWYCSILDVEHPEKISCRKLSHMALDYGVAIDPVNLHRAMADVELIGEAMRRNGVKPTQIKEYSEAPWVYMKACIPAPWEDNGRGKELAKKDGYSWETPRGSTEPKFPKTWVKRVKQSQLEAEKLRTVGFKREVLDANK